MAGCLPPYTYAFWIFVMQTYFIIGLISFAGSFVQSATGFGYAVIIMALTPLVISLRQAAAVEILASLFLQFYLFWKMHHYVRKDMLLWPALSAVAFTVLGVTLLLTFPASALMPVLGLTLTTLAAYFIFFSHRVHLLPTRRNGLIAGCLSGFFNGLFSISGPPMVAYYLSVTNDKMVYNGTLQAFFCILSSMALVMHLAAGNITLQVGYYSLAALAGVIAGAGAGFAVFRRLSLATLKKWVYAFMAIMGIYLIING